MIGEPNRGGGLAPDGAHRLQIALAVVLVVAISWNLVGNLLLPGMWYVPANLVVAVVVVAIARWVGLDVAELGLARRDLGRGLVIGLLAMAAIALVIGLGLLVPAAESAFEDGGVADDSGFDRWFVPLVRIPLGTAVFEEVLFRSVLLGLVMRWRGVRVAVVSTSILFGLWHVVPAWESSTGSGWSVVGAILGTVAITTVAGFGFALLRLWSRSVVAPVLAHTATNSLAYAAAIIALDVID